MAVRKKKENPAVPVKVTVVSTNRDGLGIALRILAKKVLQERGKQCGRQSTSE
ncbi:MAG: hypothetical protein AB1374_08910 [Bacillota bacterium]